MSPPSLAAFLSLPIRVRRRAQDVRLDTVKLRPGVRDALKRSGLLRVGDLQGRTGRDLNWLPGMRSTQLRELYRALVDRGALEPAAVVETPAPAAPMPVRARQPRRLRPPRPASPYMNAGSFREPRIWIRPGKRRVAFDHLPLSTWLANTLERYGFTHFGDLDGRWVRDLASMRRFGDTQLRELHGVLAAHDALEPVHIRVGGRRSSQLEILSTLLPNPLRNLLLAKAPPSRPSAWSASGSGARRTRSGSTSCRYRRPCARRSAAEAAARSATCKAWSTTRCPGSRGPGASSTGSCTSPASASRRLRWPCPRACGTSPSTTWRCRGRCAARCARAGCAGWVSSRG